METMLRTIVLVVGWPILVAGSIYLFIKGRKVYQLVKGSIVGNVTNALVMTMLIGMYSLGIVSTVLMFCDKERGVWVVLPIFLVWFVSFVWALKVLRKAQQDADKLTGK